MSEKNIPVLYNNKAECCGCTACNAICPKQAISMQPGILHSNDFISDVIES